MLPTTPAFDLDGDHIDDLVIGAAGADVTTTDVRAGAGKIFVAYGSAARASLPPNAIELGNRSFTGSGLFLVDEGTGRPTVFQDAPGETKPLFVLNNGADAWYTFTTLGDGMPGDAIRIMPQTLDSFLTTISAASSPTLSTSASSISVDKNQTVGNNLVTQANIDGASGSIFVADPFTTTGRITSWSVYSGAGYGNDRHVTPLILKATPDGKYQITGIGAARLIARDHPQDFDFDLVSGSDSIGPGYYLGWYDGSIATGDNQGSIGYGTPAGAKTVQWLGANQASGGGVLLGGALAPVSSFARTYSIQASVTQGAVLEFDLGQFLSLAGNPAAISTANLVLHAPSAAAPVAAPTNITAAAFSAGKLYFTASTPDLGAELWVTDGSDTGTRLVKDLNPGVVGSQPANLTDVGGTLYFTANAGVSGTKLYRTDGTTVTEIGTIGGVPAQFTVQSGRAELAGSAVSAVPAVDYSFTIDIQRESGQIDSVPVTVPRSATIGNTAVTGPNELQDDVTTALSSALAAKSLAGSISISLDGTKFKLTGVDSNIVRVTLKGGNALGFATNQASVPAIQLDGGTVPGGHYELQAVADFSLELGIVGAGAPVTLHFQLDQNATAGNLSAADLAADADVLINQAMIANGFASGAVHVGQNLAGDGLSLTVNDPTIFSLTLRGATDPLHLLGFAPDQASVRTVAMTAASAAPADGKLPADLAFSLLVTRTDGSTISLGGADEVVLLGASNAGNGANLDLLAGQVQTLINNALSAKGLAGSPISVTAVSGHLVLSSQDASILSVNIKGAGPLGFADGGATTQRAGDRLLFVSANPGENTHLWKVEGVTLHAKAPGTFK